MGSSTAPDTPPFKPSDLVGLKHFQSLRGLLQKLHAQRAHPNRNLHFDEYTALLLLYFFNPVVTSLRGIQYASTLEKVQKQLGVKRSSLGSLSTAAQVFDPNLLRDIFIELAQQAVAGDALPRPKGVPADLAVIAADGTLLDALPKMLWALWLGEHQHAVKMHIQFDLLRGVPVEADLTNGQGSEVAELEKRLRPNALYVLDRGYLNYQFFQKITAAKSSFVARLRENFDHELIEAKTLSAEAVAAGVQSDQVVWLGGVKSRSRMDKPVRVIKVHVVNPPANGLKPRLSRVDRKTKCIRTREEEFDVWLVTDQLDLPAETVALLYRYRWHIELFFRWLKCVLGCKHLLAEAENGIRIQMYAALIASLLIVLYTGRKPTKRTLEAFQFYLQGWASEKELEAHIASLKPIQ
jgi:hypothetical protein